MTRLSLSNLHFLLTLSIPDDQQTSRKRWAFISTCLYDYITLARSNIDRPSCPLLNVVPQEISHNNKTALSSQEELNGQLFSFNLNTSPTTTLHLAKVSDNAILVHART